MRETDLLLRLTSEIVDAYLSRNRVSLETLQKLVLLVYCALAGAEQAVSEEAGDHPFAAGGASLAKDGKSCPVGKISDPKIAANPHS